MVNLSNEMELKLSDKELSFFGFSLNQVMSFLLEARRRWAKGGEGVT